MMASDFQWCCLTSQGSPAATQHTVSVESLILHGTLYYLFYCDTSLTSKGFTMWSEQLA